MNQPTKNINVLGSSVISDIPKIVNRHVKFLASEHTDKRKTDEIYKALRLMLNGRYERYVFNEETFDKMLDETLTEMEFQKILSELNEKQAVRKSNGVYYTPTDVVDFMVCNCFSKILDKKEETVISKMKNISSFDNAINLAFSKHVLDPTCGSGVFLISAFQYKINLYSKNNKLDETAIIGILKTIHGNDINIESVDITKVRIFFETIKYITNECKFLEIAAILNENMTAVDFVDIDRSHFKPYDIIIGNPPYVEDSKSISKPKNKYGNIYANVLQNSLDMLSDDGVMGFIIPISYISTPRMNKIRSYIKANTSKQFVLNFADRPDCLFTSVHQKLSILVAVKGHEKHKVYTSSYQYWYKNERSSLFSSQTVCENPYINELFYPKIGNKTELSVFSKVFTADDNNIVDLASSDTIPNIFLNMRACFWIKAFSFNPGSKEYKALSYNESEKFFMLCLLNSSLYFLFWNLVSDCWHITAKELKHFKVPNKKTDCALFETLAIELENELEKTKKYIGSKQTDYEYKHKLCKKTIDKIDDALASVYGLTKTEVTYIKSFASKYRESLGA